jgi:hypothetical protein
VHASDVDYSANFIFLSRLARHFGSGALARTSDADFGLNPMQRKLKLSASGDEKDWMCREENKSGAQLGTK